MQCKGFVVAMRGRIAPMAFDRPYRQTEAGAPDWLIVSRWGGDAEYLTISSATLPEARAAENWDGMARSAPAALHPRRTWFGVLTPSHEGPESIFLLNRDLPKGMPVAGSFAPAEGYARLITEDDGTLRLVAVAREVPEAEAGSAPPPVSAQAWHMTAERLPWLGEFVDCSQG